MVSKLFRHTSFIKQLALLLTLPLAVSSTGYALFTQQLSISTQATKPLYSSSQSLRATYTKTEAPSGNTLLHTYNPMTITNTGSGAVTAWQLKFDPPAGFSQLSCPATVTCTTSGATVTIVNRAANGTINPGGNVQFSFTYKSSTPNYTLQNIYISGTLAPVYQTMAGLTVGFVKGTATKKGKTWTYPHTFTVTNSSGQNVSAWRAICTWNAQPATSTISTTVNYVTSASNITFTSKTALNTGSNIVFTGSFTSTSATWAISTCSVQGSL